MGWGGSRNRNRVRAAERRIREGFAESAKQRRPNFWKENSNFGGSAIQGAVAIKKAPGTATRLIAAFGAGAGAAKPDQIVWNDGSVGTGGLRASGAAPKLISPES